MSFFDKRRSNEERWPLIKKVILVIPFLFILGFIIKDTAIGQTEVPFLNLGGEPMSLAVLLSLSPPVAILLAIITNLFGRSR